MDDRRVADYFVVAGLPDNPQPLEEFSNEAAIKPTYKQDPITDITVINKTLGEKVPRGYICLDKTPTEYLADLNHGSIRCPELFICYRRSRDKPPLTDVGVLYEGKERLMAGCEVVHTTYFGSPASVNNTNSSRIYITYRRAAENAPSDMLAVVDLCVILENKNEIPPHSYCQIHKNLNKGLVGSDVYLCYKKAMTKMDILAYKPAILDRYPKEDYEDFPLPDNVPMFCLPMGATIECWSAKAQHPFPVFSTFILTGQGWNKVYGAAITFYEEFPENKLTDLQMRHLGLKNKHIREQYRIMKTVHSNRSICLLSHWPFFDAFRKLLSYMYRISITGPHTVPIERHISHFMYDVPYPSPQRPRILVQLAQDSLSLSMPEDSPLPQSGASFITLLKNLGPENCMTILLYVLHEYKILIHSLRPAVLTSVAEAVSTLIFPLQWQCPYIPLCPLDLSLVLNAPTPYIIGLDSRYFDLFDPPPDVICIDLDTIRIWPGEDKKNVTYKMLPKKPTKVLQETLHTLYDRLAQELPRHNQDEITLDMAPIDYDFKRKHKETLLELQIQEAFLRFMACLMKGYKQFLKPIENAPNIDTTNAASLFDMAAFLKSRDKANQKFFQTLMRTQLFNRFIEERSFVSDKDDSLAFFDECTEKVDENKDEPKLIELDDSSKSERTMFILPPEPVGLPEGKTYSYNGFPQLNSELFLERKTTVTSTQSKGKVTHNSPVARRTKQEIRTAQKLAQQCQTQPEMWAQCLLSNCYSLWFMMLPAFIKNTQAVTKTLNVAYEVLKTMQRQKLKPPDELCYRAMLQLCGQYNQPVLAVKVYSEMKHAGVQPNAITYGYYNKAVLEGKWPSSISKGRKLWRKVRNVIIGVAKFRKAIRRRSLSVYSNSGSEFDQTSIDSFLEDGHLDGKHESIMKGEVETGVNGTTTKRGAELERAPSDRGYNSMTQEDAKNFSEMISTENKEEAKESKVKKEVKNVLRFSFRKKKKETEIQEENDDAFKSSNSAQQFRSRVGSIVRQHSQPGTMTSSHETLKGSLIGSSAGLLMVSDSLTVGSLPHSMGPVGRSLAAQESTRKRHRSAGDHHQLKTRSNSLYANFRQRHPSQEDHMSDLTVTDEDPKLLLEDIGGSSELRSEMQDIKEEIKDSGVALDENDATGCEGFMFQDDVLLEEEGGESSSTANPSSDTLVNSESKFRDSRSSSVEGQKGRAESLKSATSSPLHSVPTPVTENDPLGLFMDGQLKVAARKSPTPKTSPQKSRESFELRKPFEEELKNKNNRVESLSLGECNNSDKNRVEKPISSMSGRVMSPVDRVQKTLFSKMERTNSFPESLGNATGGEANKTRGDAHSNETVSLGRSSTSLYDQRTDSSGTPKGDFRLFRTGSFRRHKENFSGMLKFATGAVASKITEIKLSMTPSKLGSNTSLTPSHDDVDSVDEDSYHESSRRKKGSIDFLNRSDDKLDSSSINGSNAFESAPAHPSFMDQIDRMCEQERHHVPHVQFTCEPKDILVEVEICSLSRCQRCHCLLYDEEIMAGWNPDDSNLNTNCSFCNNKVVPHLLIYLKDKRGKKKNLLVDINGEEDSDLDPGENHITPSDQSYGKDADLCQTSSGDNQLLFGEDLDDTGSVKSFDSPNDPWVKQTGHSTSHGTDIPSPSRAAPSDMSLSDAAYTARHRRTASECLTSATENMYGSSVESHDSITFRNMRSSLSISIDETEAVPSHPVRQDSKQAIFDRGAGQMEPVSVPYLSPIVLRKNLENIIESEGNSSLSKDTFLDEHPIIFWNLVWYFKRISTSSHLPGFLLTAKSYNKDSEENKPEQRLGSESVHVRVMWDNIRIHNEIGLPMHMAWNKGHSSTTVDALITESQPFNRAVMHQIITSITHCSDVLTPIKIVMNGRRRYRLRRKRFRSMYREILYLAFVACGRENIDPDAYDREFKYAYSKLSPGEIKRLQRDDKPRSQMVKCCRNAFCDLEV